MTKQRKTLIEFLEKNQHKEFSAEEIVKIMSDKELSRSAIYRNLSYLEEKEQVKSHVKEGSRERLYQIVCKCDCKNKIHLVCVKCGEILNINLDLTNLFMDKVFETTGFKISINKTLINGVCEKCRKL
ncbi:MAG: Fur family transcriptional regulator [Lachnospirales bacterium]